jgi:uncharacterized protein (TIGR03435 family)
MRCLAIATTLSLTLLSSPSAQQPAALDVVSVRESRSDAPSPRVRFTPARLDLVNMTVESIVGTAHDLRSQVVRDRLIVGWPKDGLKQKRFDITATLRGGDRVTYEDQRRLILEILTTRFGFKAHTEVKPLRVYALKQIKKGVLGSKLRRVDFDCFFGHSAAEGPKGSDGSPLCTQGFASRESGFLLRGAGDLKQLAAVLQNTLQSIVIDATDLQGNFAWEADVGLDTGAAIVGPLRRDLALTFEVVTTNLDVVVIDSVSMPSPN